jgi:hypothetical protein
VDWICSRSASDLESNTSANQYEPSLPVGPLSTLISVKNKRGAELLIGSAEPVGLTSSDLVVLILKMNLSQWKSRRSLPSQTPDQDLSPHSHWPEAKDFKEHAG